ncbi:IS701 family transposase [Kitasatospora phosalacinea]|uniref:IS701 family transposase n=1 Tax=Kitasatospora phosalacinea TaxID=2065 RepID=UPI00365E7691
MTRPGILYFPPTRALDGIRFARGAGPAFEEFCEHVFAALPRSDQRRYGHQYLSGLLQLEGRKSSRNLSTLSGRTPDEQRLHHFVNASPWQWEPVRRAAAGYLLAATAPTAWVVSPLYIRKYGRQAAGVERRFVPGLGQTFNTQLALGLWTSGAGLLAPVDWTLVLPRSAFEEPDRRSGTALPTALQWVPLVESVAQSALHALQSWDVPRLPVLLDARQLDVEPLAERFRRADVRVLLRIGPEQRLTAADPALRGACPPDLPAHRILHTFRHGRRLTGWPPGVSAGAAQTGLEAGVRVRLQPAGAGPHTEPGDYLLVAGGRRERGWPSQLWLTDLVTLPSSLILRMGTALEQVGREAELTGDAMGLRDFSGRSYAGWHRHMTLVSAAIAAAALGRPYYTRIGAEAA